METFEVEFNYEYWNRYDPNSKKEREFMFEMHWIDEVTGRFDVGLVAAEAARAIREHQTKNDG